MARPARILVPEDLEPEVEDPLVVTKVTTTLEAVGMLPPSQLDFVSLRAFLTETELRYCGTKGDKKLLLLAKRAERGLLGPRAALVEAIIGDYELLPGVQKEFEQGLRTYNLRAEVHGRLTPPDNVLSAAGWKHALIGGQKLFYLEPPK